MNYCTCIRSIAESGSNLFVLICILFLSFHSWPGYGYEIFYVNCIHVATLVMHSSVPPHESYYTYILYTMPLRNAHPFFLSKQTPVLKHINKLRVDAQNANATPSLALFSAFSTFLFPKHPYCIIHCRKPVIVEILGKTGAFHEKKYLLSLKRVTSKPPFSGTFGIVSGSQTGRGIFLCLRAGAPCFAM